MLRCDDYDVATYEYAIKTRLSVFIYNVRGGASQIVCRIRTKCNG